MYSSVEEAEEVDRLVATVIFFAGNRNAISVARMAKRSDVSEERRSGSKSIESQGLEAAELKLWSLSILYWLEVGQSRPKWLLTICDSLANKKWSHF